MKGLIHISKKQKNSSFVPAKDKTARQRQKFAIKKYYSERKTHDEKVVHINPGRIIDSSGKPRVPLGRTLKTKDKYLDKTTTSEKERPVVVIETNDDDELAVVSLSTKNGSHRTQLKDYLQGQSYFKHFIEIEDAEGNPIKVNDKFKESSPKLDVSGKDVVKIRDKVFYHSAPSPENLKKIEKFRKK